jgi:hypothetical protein
MKPKTHADEVKPFKDDQQGQDFEGAKIHK